MDAFVQKVSQTRVPDIRVVSLRSVDSIELARLRSTVRYLARQRDERLRLLGLAALRSMTGAADERDVMREQASAVSALEQQIAVTERKLHRAQTADRLAVRDRSPFLTVCSCGAPVMPQDAACAVCHRDVENLVRLASESKSRVATVPCRCGSPLVAGIRFCPDCGRGVEDLLASAGLAGGQAVACQACGEFASLDDRFCSTCGKALG